MKKLRLRFWYLIAGFAILAAIEILNDNLAPSATVRFLISDLISWAFCLCLLLLFYIIVRNIIQAIKARQNPKKDKHRDGDRY